MKLINKRIATLMLMLGLLLPSITMAQTTSTSSIATMLAQIVALQAQIAVLQSQQQQNVSTLITLLQQGSRGDAVVTLQALLAADPDIYPEGTISGYFGPLTAAAVKRFQNKHGLEQVGNVGPKTLNKLKELLKEHPVEFAVDKATSTPNSKTLCAKVPPGHLIAPGWLRKMDGMRPIVPPCQTLPPGIQYKITGTTTPTTTPDTVAPVISSISISGISSTTATVSWSTVNELATGRVYYATATPVNLSSALSVGSSSLLTNHSFTLENLTAMTTYYYVLESKDTSGNTATTSSLSFITTD